MLRDVIFSHVRKIASAGPSLSPADAKKYAINCTLIACGAYLTTLTIGLVSSQTHTLQQEWLINLRDVCGKKYDTDADGNLVANSDGMYYGTITDYAQIFGLLGLILGQIAFRASGFGKLLSDAHTSKPGFTHQILMAATMIFLYMMPGWIAK